MHAVFGGSTAGARKTDGQISPVLAPAQHLEQKQERRPDRFVRRINGQRIQFCELARFAWPDKTEFHLAHLTRVDPRTCRRWLAGDNEPPAEALGVVLAEIMKRFHQRD
jgi:hypothetical protein